MKEIFASCDIEILQKDSIYTSFIESRIASVDYDVLLIHEQPSNWEKYYDRYIDPAKYDETSAPTEVQFYFYARENAYTIFEDRSIKDFDTFFSENKLLMVGFIDWGDGQQDFYDEPKALSNNTIITHTYEASGIYDVTGYMFSVKYNPAQWYEMTIFPNT